MRRLALLLAWLPALCPVAVQAQAKPPVAADPAPPLVDVSAQKKLFRVFTDGKGHYLAMTIDPKSMMATKELVFFADGKVFFRQEVGSGARAPEYIIVRVLDPRYRRTHDNGIVIRSRKLSFSCGAREIVMPELAAAEAKRLVDKAEFRDVFWRRHPHALARDDKGTYYYVDQIEGPVQLDSAVRQTTGQRVFVGPRERMKLLPMKNVVRDPAGELFITAGGKLRLKLDRTADPPSWAATWLAGRKNVRLTVVDLEQLETVPMIYNELGVYSGLKLQKPCDVF